MSRTVTLSPRYFHELRCIANNTTHSEQEKAAAMQELIRSATGITLPLFAEPVEVIVDWNDPRPWRFEE